MFDGALKQGDDRGGQECRHEVGQQPGQALLEGFPGRRGDTLVTRDPGQAQQVFARLVLDDVDHVVHSDDADELVLFVNHRHGQQVVRSYLPRDFLLVGINADARDLGGHDALERRLRRDQQQAAQ